MNNSESAHRRKDITRFEELKVANSISTEDNTLASSSNSDCNSPSKTTKKKLSKPIDGKMGESMDTTKEIQEELTNFDIDQKAINVMQNKRCGWFQRIA